MQGTSALFNGSTFLNNDGSDAFTDTVFANSDLDRLTCGLGQDWFFGLAEEITVLVTGGSTPNRRT